MGLLRVGCSNIAMANAARITLKQGFATRKRFIVGVDPWHFEPEGRSEGFWFSCCVSLSRPWSSEIHLSFKLRNAQWAHSAPMHRQTPRDFSSAEKQRNGGIRCARRPLWNSGTVQNISVVLILNSWHAAFLFIFIRSWETWLWQTCVIQYKSRFIATLTSLNNRFAEQRELRERLKTTSCFWFWICSSSGSNSKSTSVHQQLKHHHDFGVGATSAQSERIKNASLTTEPQRNR